jgi:hypothetical protein
MTSWRVDLAAAIRLVRSGGTATPRVELLAAAGIGLIVLVGALATYVVLPRPAAPSPAATTAPSPP